jgi:hypothetical protein
LHSVESGKWGFGSSHFQTNETVLGAWEAGQSGRNGLFRVSSPIISREGAAPEFIEFFRPMFRRIAPTKQFGRATKPFSVLAQMSGNSRRLSGASVTAPTVNRRQSDAEHQLHPRLRLYRGGSFDGWFFHPGTAGRRNFRV